MFVTKNTRVKFGVLTDSHYADREPGGTRFYRDSLLKMRKAVDFLNTQELDFIVHLGDFKDEDAQPVEEKTLKHLQKIEAEFTRFNGPTYHVIGNHDIDSISKSQFLENVTNTGIKSDQAHYFFDVKSIRFIVLDANFLEDGTPYHKGNFNWRDTWIPKEQIDWLEGVLAESELPCVIFVHQLLDPSNAGDSMVKNSDEVREVITNSAKVLLVLQGHKHEEVYTLIQKTHYYTFNGMVDHEGIENNSFSIVTIDEKQNIVIDGFYRSTNRKFNLSLNSDPKFFLQR